MKNMAVNLTIYTKWIILEKTNHQAYQRRKTGNLNNPVSIILKKWHLPFKTSPKLNSSPSGFPDEFCQLFREEIIPILQTLTEEVGKVFNSLHEAGILKLDKEGITREETRDQYDQIQHYVNYIK